MNKVAMYIAAHKKFDVPSIDCYVPIEVGAALRDEHFGYVRDDDGDNISNQNPFFCELTAYYWIWKNSGADIVGLSHYRRYFSRYRINPDEKYYMTAKEITDLLEKYDIILPEHFYWRKHTVETGYYAGAGVGNDLDTVGKIIEELYPEYAEAFRKVLVDNESSYCNMFVMRKKDFDDYCEWLFTILFEAKRRIDISGYTKKEKRIFGYMSEILINVWVRQNNKKVCYKPMVVRATKGKRTRLLGLFEKMGFTKIAKAIYCVDARF